MVRAIIPVAMLVIFGAVQLTFNIGCTKKSPEKRQAEQAQTPTQPSTTTPPATPSPGLVEATQSMFALQSIAGDLIFCQTFSTPSKMPQITDLESAVNSLAGAQAGLPAGMINPFNVQSLGLSVKENACSRVPELLSGGHCALTVQKQSATGSMLFSTEQRLFWKDIPTLVQAANVKASLDAKTNLLSTKNALMLSLNQQLTQQRQILKFLEDMTGQPGMIADAQALLESLQTQIGILDKDIKALEDEIKPIQDEMNTRINELNTARAALKLACNPGGMGATAASWKEH